MENTELRKTALTHIHEALGAKMVPFAGYYMPVQYQGLNEEHHTVRNHLGVFDVSHMGEFFLRGENALALIQKVTLITCISIELIIALLTVVHWYEHYMIVKKHVGHNNTSSNRIDT
ncbi:MAG: hypothetical protein ACKOW8_05835, partial [Flavobacteriales bacterium]